MSVKDMLLALCVVVAWGVNFVVIKLGLQGMPPFLLAGLRFALVAFPALLFVKRPAIPLRWLVIYGMTISFGQFAFLFLAIKLGDVSARQRRYGGPDGRRHYPDNHAADAGGGGLLGAGQYHQ